MLQRISAVLVLASLLAAPAGAAELPYTEGTVWQLSFIRTEMGRQPAYLEYLATKWQAIMEEAKKQGLILSYRVLRGVPGSAEDWDILLVTEVKNMAALDDVEKRWNAIGEKVFGGKDERAEAAVARGEIRKWLGDKTVRELVLNERP